MRYTYFEFENFKGIRKGRLELTGRTSSRVHTLVGLNESGKTTVLEAIDHFQSSEGEVSPKELGGWVPADPHSIIPIAELTNFKGRIVIRCGIELDDEDVEAVADALKAEGGYRLTDISREIAYSDISVYDNSQFQNRHGAWTGLVGRAKSKTGSVEREFSAATARERWSIAARTIRERLPTVWYFPNFLFDFPNKIYLVAHAGETAENRFFRTLFQDILSALGQNLTINKHVVDRAVSGDASDEEALRHVLLRASRHVTETVVNSWNDMFKDKPITQKRVQIDLGSDAPDDATGEAGRLWVRFRLEDSDGLFSVSQRSLGFRWFFVYLLITAYRGARVGGSGDIVFLFDEPASNLHSSAQTALLESLGEISEKAVVIYTTHSHHLIDPQWLDTTYVISNEGLGAEALSADFSAGRTDIKITAYREFAATRPDQRNYFQPILDVLEWAPSRLELVPAVAMVEGKSDYYLLEFYQAVMLGLPPGERLRLMPRGGSGTLDDVIQLYIGWARPFVALLDSDRAGLSERDRYLEKFGPVLDGRVVELAEASGNDKARGIESLLLDNDKLAFQRLVDPAATRVRKKVLALGVQEALVTGQQVKMSAAARKRLDKVLRYLRERLDDVGTSSDRV